MEPGRLPSELLGEHNPTSWGVGSIQRDNGDKVSGNAGDPVGAQQAVAPPLIFANPLFHQPDRPLPVHFLGLHLGVTSAGNLLLMPTPPILLHIMTLPGTGTLSPIPVRVFACPLLLPP